MNQIVRYAFTISILIYILTHLGASFMEREWLLGLMSLSGLSALLSALLLLKMKRGLVPLFLTGTSLVLGYFTLEDQLWTSIWAGIRQMRSIILLLFFVPMIGWVLREENYIEALIGSAQNVIKTSRRFYAGLMFLTQIIAHFILFASIPMVFQFVKILLGDKKDDAWEHYKATALSRGFGLSTIWVISIPSVVYIIYSIGASLFLTVIQGFFISVCGILLSLLFISLHEKRSGLNFTTGIAEELQKKLSHIDVKEYRPLSQEFIILFITLFVPILALNTVLDWGLLMIIAICIFVWACLYFIVKKKWLTLGRHMHAYLDDGLSRRAQEIGILLSAGMLITVFNQSGLGLGLVDAIFFLSERLQLHLLWVLPFLVIILGFVGLGPLTVMVLVGGILQEAVIPYPPELVVLSLTLGSAISVFISPFILPIIVLSQANGLSVWKNGLKFNWAYAITFYILVQIYLMVMLRFYS